MTTFSGGPARHTETIKVNPDKVLGVLNHAYSVEKDGINVNMEFPCADECREVFVLGNEGCGVRILSSTGWLDRIDVSGKTLSIRAGSDTEILLDIQGKKKESHRIPAGKTLTFGLE